MAIIYNTAATLNGFIADEHNSLQWLFDVPGNDHAESDFSNFLSTVSAIVMGSTTYQWLVDQLDLLNSPENWTRTYGSRPTWVFSSRDLAVPSDTGIRIINSPVGRVLPAIRESAAIGSGAGHVWVVGGGDLAGQFLDADALDRITMTVAPVFLAGGAPLFPRRLDSDRLELSQLRQVGRFVELTFEISSPAARS